MTLMKYREIDLNTYPRKGQFDYFESLAYPYVGVTVKVDISDFAKKVKERSLPFFLSFLYQIGRAADAVPEFRQRVVDGHLIEYETCLCSYTVSLPDNTYCYCDVPTDMPFDDFLLNAQKLQDEAIQNPSVVDEDPLPLYFISCVPWLHYESLIQPTPSPADYNPRLTFGKYREENGKLLIPVSVLVNHALCDGYHINAFFDALNSLLAKF